MHLRHQMIKNRYAAFRVEFVNILLECSEAQLVTVFKVTVVFCMLLDSIISKVHKSIIYILKVNAEF